MHGLPFVNPALAVAVLGFREFGGSGVGVLLTPWFMNLVVLPAGGTGDRPQGERVEFALPGGTLDLTVHCDEELGGYLSAVLFRDVVAIPDMDTARRLAADVLAQLFDETAAPAPRAARQRLSRRALLSGGGPG
jgi:[NiFe] hydrogenase assembly HybE family chaperone